MTDQINNLLTSFRRRNIPCFYVKNRREAAKWVLSHIQPHSTVGIGGSETINELKIELLLKEKGCTVYWHWHAKNPEEAAMIRHKAMNADTYLCSSNAISEDGRLVNIDGTGNRVASMVFGPKKVLVVAGINKIAENLDNALQRVKDVACPLNARRLGLNTPCAKTGKCHDCNSPHRMCNVTTIIEGKPSGVDMHVLIVGENIGF
ncbi:MAG: lactate utilization protein [Bacillota bacterium]|nr:lactate utilization protein [Bacillota bacterium]